MSVVAVRSRLLQFIILLASTMKLVFSIPYIHTTCMLLILVDTSLKTMFYLKKIGILTQELDANTSFTQSDTAENLVVNFGQLYS